MIRVRHLAIGYGPGLRSPEAGRSGAIVRDISFDIAPGECILLAGANGCGKSTLLKTLAGVLPPISGSLGDAPAKGLESLRPRQTGRGPRSGKAFPDPLPGVPFQATLIPTGIPKVRGFSAAEFIRTSCYTETDWKGAFSREEERRMEEAAGLLGIRNLLDRDISTLSDGEFQLACIAAGLTRRCDLLLFDEPTAFLDVDNRIMVLRALKRAAAETPVLFSSHDVRDAAPLVDRIFAITPEGTFETSDPSSKETVLHHAFQNL